MIDLTGKPDRIRFSTFVDPLTSIFIEGLSDNVFSLQTINIMRDVDEKF